MVDTSLHGDHEGGAAKRRRDGRLRMHWRHEQLTLRMALAAALHHSCDVGPVTYNALRSQRTARAGGGNEQYYTAKFWNIPPPQAAGAGHFAMDVGEAPPAGRPAPLLEVLPKVRVLRRTVEQNGAVVPLVLALADSMPQMVDQLVAVLARYDMPLADQVIEVPKVSCPARCGRTVLCTPQTAEQLVEVPTILTPSFLRMLQNVDTPVPGRGVQRGLQGFSQQRSSTAFGGPEFRFPAATAEQNVDIPVPGGSLHGLSISGSSSSSAVSRDVRGDCVFSHFSPG